MKFKLDENLGDIGRALLEAEGHDVMSVAEQRLSGCADRTIYEVCREENRVLVTLDRDFGEVLRFPPEATFGIVILDCKGRITQRAIATRTSEFAVLMRTEQLDGVLWIVEPGRIRIHEPRQK